MKVLVSLIIADSDYQQAQAAAAEEVARGLNLRIEIIYAGTDAVHQTQQLVKAIQDRANRPDAVLVEPVGTGMDQIAAAAVAAGVGWGIVNREVNYLARLRRSARAPVFAVSTDQLEVGRIQGRQFAALLGQGGSVLYIEGPSTAGATQQRRAGMMSTKPADASVKTLKGDWSEGSAYRVVKSWLLLSTARQLDIQVIGCQNDLMAAGARKAFEELPSLVERDHWLSLPFTGCDGVPKTGLKQVSHGLLSATVIIPPTMGLALQILHNAVKAGSQPPELTLSAPTSFPTPDELARKPVAAQ